MVTAPGEVPIVADSWLLGAARRLQRDQLSTYLSALEDHGDHVRFRVGPPGIGLLFDAVFSPEGAHEVLAANRDHYVKDAPAYREFAHLFGRGIAVADGERWTSRRRLLQPMFTPQRVAAAVPQVTDAASGLVERLRAGATGPGDSGPGTGMVDLVEPSTWFALRALGHTVFGGEEIEHTMRVMRATLPALSEYAARRGLAPVRLPHQLPTPANRRAERHRRTLHGVVDELVRSRSDRTEGDDILRLLLDARDPETGAGLTPREVRDEVLIFLVAGFETTASAVALALYLLGRHPEHQERVHGEVEHVLGRRDPGPDDLERLTHSTQVVQETLRLYPSLHTLVRRTSQPTTLLCEELPRGRVVAVSVWGIHRNPALWPEPDRFDPGRFDPDSVADRDRFAHLPFGAGPRSCIGNHLALVELVVAVAMVVRAFHLESVDVAPDLDAGITLRPVAPLGCRLTAR